MGSFVYYVNAGRVQISAGYAPVSGLPDEETQECGIDEWRARVHPDDLAELAWTIRSHRLHCRITTN